jgi:hypothetical protein
LGRQDRTCTAEGAAQEKFWAAREQFCKTLAAEKPDALSKKMRKEMAKVVPEIADTPTTTHKEINRLRGKFQKEAIAELHRALRGKLPTTKKPLNPRQKRSEAQRRRPGSRRT